MVQQKSSQKREWKPSSKDNSMKKTKEAKRRENKKWTWNEDLWTHQVYCQHQLMSKPTKKSVFFRIKMERVSIFFFFLFSAFCYLSILSFFCLLLFFLLHFATYILRKLVSLFLSLSTFQVINMGFLNEMWYKGLIQKILGCGDFYFYFLFFSDEKATLYNILILLGALGSGLNGL